MENFDKIKEFVLKERGRYKKELTKFTTLEKDLRITGDDSVEFLETFSKEFNVDITNFDFNKHFAPEGSLALIALTLFGKETGKQPLTLGDLERAIERGQLIK